MIYAILILFGVCGYLFYELYKIKKEVKRNKDILRNSDI